ncbi:MAG TPA: bifunctional pyr operon transcriptional regulator/uracil phosphoribosyltransferase PyrR [Gemmatimonadales bacterium]|jgi:pyrimidine operon attenuation protein/uracil phosphoribosyltransferase|nr:bifunctional pyr operon transcriptional regulator/uracil phosphoribosyltransferase PyrR [Gemmatimonadales bacterium]
MPAATSLLDATAIGRTLVRMANEIVEQSGGAEGLVIVGIQRRGAELAERIARLIETSERVKLSRGKLDITLYRDDLQTVGPAPVVGATELPFDLTGKTVVIVDDVLYTGRTVRAALDELADFGRPRRILLAVLVDRGGRELPIQPDITGLAVAVPAGQTVSVQVQERDGRDAVDLVPRASA